MLNNRAIEVLPWSIAIFAARETPEELMLTLGMVLSAASKPAQIDLVINGNEALAAAIAERISTNVSTGGMSSVRVWFLALGDKANAWNQYVYSIWPGGEITFFVDGYVHPDGNAFGLLESCLLEPSQALGATGVPGGGRSARHLREKMIKEGGIHGNLFCLKKETVERITESGFRLPLGLYRTDGTIGAALRFNLDPANNEWEPARIRVQPDASWSTKKRNWWRLSDSISQVKRMLRQAQGAFENRAVRQHCAIRRAPVSDLPPTAAELVLNWARDCPDDAREIENRNFLYQRALKNLKRPRNWDAANIPPKLLHIQDGC